MTTWELPSIVRSLEKDWFDASPVMGEISAPGNRTRR
jgi:hypothetical protein